MKKNIENFDTFIIEQKVWFEENLAADFAESWDSLVWICGKKDYTNRTNLTRKALETIALKHKDRLDDTATDGDDTLITIRGFLNIVSLIQRVENGTEKIALNCLLLLIITGFRSVEAFNLRQDALVKRKIDNSDISRRLRDKGLPDYLFPG